MDSAINGLLQSLDPYSAYMSPEIFNEMQTETSGEFGGLGIEVGMESGVVKVISPIDDTPASRAGIKAGDYIVKIKDTQVQGKTLSEAVDLMRGPVGSGIELTVRRIGEKKALVFNIVREVIQVQSVKSELLEDNIGYIRLTSFNDNSSNQIEKQIKKLKKDKNLNSFILDLRISDCSKGNLKYSVVLRAEYDLALVSSFGIFLQSILLTNPLLHVLHVF